MLPGQSGKIVATFISRSTSAAAGNGTPMSNAAVTAQTASSWKTQPSSWKKPAATAAPGVRSTASPCRAIVSSRRTVPRPSTCTRARSRRAEITPTVKSASPTRPTTTIPVTAQCGIFAVARTYATSSAIGKRSNRRCAKTVPRSVALVPGRPFGRCRRKTATRASSPARAGSTAFPRRPTPNAENTCRKRGNGSGRACRIVRFHDMTRTSTETRLRKTPTTTQRQLTKSKAW